MATACLTGRPLFTSVEMLLWKAFLLVECWSGMINLSFRLCHTGLYLHGGGSCRPAILSCDRRSQLVLPELSHWQREPDHSLGSFGAAQQRPTSEAHCVAWQS